MANEADTKDQALLDARMEYGHLVTMYISLANTFWLGYGAFFTINTLLATGLFFSYSEAARSFDLRFLTLLHFLIPLTGIVISLVAIYAAWAITKLQRVANKRGRELETLLFARIFAELQATTFSERFPIATTIGSLLFLAAWAGALCIAV